MLAHDVDKRVADQLAGAQLALRRSQGTAGVAGVLLAGHLGLLLLAPPGIGRRL
ncbi:hypothetical protein HMPREF0185_02552 [Brevundimonas diminuta 470-4]|nr:hypothetical protein HMPREF0185_02552 [Brevundimonas diminuta 470-4]